MKPRSLLILSLLALGLGAFIFFYEKDLPSTEERAALEKKVLRLADDAVEAVLIEWDGREARLERQRSDNSGAESGDEGDAPGSGDDGWRISAPMTARADRAAVDRLVASLTGLESSRTLDAFDPAELGFDAPRARVTLVTAEGQSVLEIGAEVPASSDMVLTVAGSGRAYLVGSSLLDDLTKEPGDWRDKKLLAASRGEIERVTLEGPGGRILLARRGDAFWLESPLADRADEDKVDSLMSQLTGLTVERFLDETPLTPEGMGLEPAAGVVEAVLAGREQPFRLELGDAVEEGGETVYGHAAGELFEVRTRLTDLLATAAADWRSRAWTPLQVFKIESARFERAGSVVEVRRDGADWLRGEERIAYSAVSDLLYPITELEGERVVERAEAAELGHDLAAPALEIAVTTQDGGEHLALFGAVEGLAAATAEGRDAVLLVAEADAAEVFEQLDALEDAEPLPPEEEEEGAGGDAPESE